MADAAPTPLTPPYVPIIDPQTGQMHRAWYMFFLSLFRGVRDADDWQRAPLAVDVSGDIAAAVQTAQLAAQIGATQADVAVLQTAVQGLALAPPVQPVRRRRYGTFYDTTTQTAAAINTAYAVTFNTTDLSSGVYVGSPTSRVIVDTEGVYDFQFSAQLDNTSGGNHLAYIWCRVNGVDVAQSASQVRLKGNDGELVAAWNYVLSLKANDYFELMWSVSDTAVQIIALAAAAPVPAIPSVILTVTDNIANNG